MASPKTVKKPRSFPPSLAGQCLRYSVMDLLGFGRLLPPETLLAMQEGTRYHKRYQEELLKTHIVRAIEAPIKDIERGISGRIDAIIDGDNGPVAIEYKSVNPEKFMRIAEEGPLVLHWAQLHLYLAMGSFARGWLVVESRASQARLIFQTEPDPMWGQWVLTRVGLAREYQASRKLPVREISDGCLACDRWQRCFKTEAERDSAVMEHPVWQPDPPMPDELRMTTVS